MARLEWGVVGDRFYEAGVDRGVLYVDGEDGVSWNGLTSVSNSSSGGDLKLYYLDGYNYLTTATSEDYEGVIKAFYSPRAFDACDGIIPIYQGLFATQQERKSFGLSYRTQIGNDIDGTDHAYKIHMIYNAMALPTQRTHETLSDNQSISPLSWSIKARPTAVPGALPSAHIILDTSGLSPWSVLALEEVLYGTSSVAPRLPLPMELISILENAPTSMLVTDNGDGTFTVQSQGQEIQMIDVETFQISSGAVTIIDPDTYTISSL